MAYVFGRAYRGFKWVVSGLGGAGGVAGIVYGAATGGTGAIVWGALLTTQSMIIAGDTYRSGKDLDKYIDEQRSAWQQQKQQLDTIITQYREEHERFLNAVRQSDAQLARMKALQSAMSEDRAVEYAEYKAQIASLEGRLQRLGELEEHYMRENARLSEAVHEATLQVGDLSDENERLQAIERELKAQVVKLRDLHEQSKQLLKNLVLAGDTFANFHDQFGSAAERLQSTSERVETNVDDLQATLALLKDVAQQLHTEHVRSLGAALAPPAPDDASASATTATDFPTASTDDDDDDSQCTVDNFGTAAAAAATAVAESKAAAPLSAGTSKAWFA